MSNEYLEALVANWDEQKISEFQTEFLAWYDRERRLLPWRESNNPYYIWVSEIMLQQTQVVTVIPYFHRFMEWFPTIADLAEAPEEKILKAWEGLGYYSRVRNMQIAAQQIMTEFNGEMPQTIAEISTLKGIGPYTAGAIGSIAFGLPEPAIDGNVMRVFSRLFEISDDIAKASSRKTFDFVVRKLISHEDPSSFNQAIMDLGSGTCTPTSPKCEECPLKSYCLSFENQRMTDFPVKSKKAKSKPLYYLANVIQNQEGAFLLEQRPSQGLLANLWTFPLSEVPLEDYQGIKENWLSYQESQDNQLSLELVAEEDAQLITWAKNHVMSQEVIWQKQPVGEITHIFSHLKWHVMPVYGKVAESQEINISPRQKWVNVSDFEKYPFPKPQQKLVQLLENYQYLKE